MTTEKTTIVLSDAAPVSIVTANWPVIACAKWWEGEHEFQSFRKARIYVREHSDGRRIVYGWASSASSKASGPGGGFLVAKPGDRGEGQGSSDEETIRAIRRVAGVIDHPELGDECIGDLPAHDLE